MLRKIIKIDEDKCNGCGACAEACHENAIGMVNGKAKLLHDHYCDGLGDCLPACPTGAITFEMREAAAYDEAAVKANQAAKKAAASGCAAGGCPGSAARTLSPAKIAAPSAPADEVPSQLRQWPVQIKLAPISAPFFDDANLLISADCAAYACGDFHTRFMRNRVVLIGCPKLDEGDYAEKLTEIIRQNNIKSVTVVRMAVPCCGGIENAVKRALQLSGKFIPWQVITVATDGRILE